MKKLLPMLMIVASCGTDAQVQRAAFYGDLRFEVTPTADYDFTIYRKNGGDIGGNPDNKQVRDAEALSYMRSQCPNARIVSEEKVKLGEHLLGGDIATYVMRIKCNP